METMMKETMASAATGTDQRWQPEFSLWRHGGWYVDNLSYPSGAVGCVSRNYPDGKWRIVCDPRPFESRPTFKNRIEAAFAERELIEELSRNQQPDHAESESRDFSNFRVEYVAPTKPEHTFEPCCWIVADSVTYGEECRVFDVPDPDESQREVAEFACRAMNGFEALVGAARTLLAMNNCNYDRDQMRRSGGFQQLEEAVAQVDAIRCSG
jgi:hypothetical protein